MIRTGINKGRQRLEGGHQDFPPRFLRIPGVIVPGCHDVHVNHQGGRQHEAGEHTAHEQRGNGDIGGDAVDDERDAGRDDRPQAGGRTGHGSRHAIVVARLLHGREHDDSYGNSGRHGGPGNGGEDGAGHDRGMAQSAADVPNKGTGEVHQVRREAAFVHEVAGQHEEWDGEEGKTGQSAEGGLNQSGDRDGAADQGVNHGATAEGNGNGSGDA